MKAISLDSLQQLSLTKGSDRVLNNLITSDLSKVTDLPQWTAFCNVNGQVITTSWIRKVDSGFVISCDASIVDTLMAHIQHHALRNQFHIESTKETCIPSNIHTIELAIEHQYPIITKETSEQFIPQMLGMSHHQGAINLEKGCYLGQEIIMRAEQLGKVKRTLRTGTIHQTIENGDIFDPNAKVCGKVVNVSENKPYIFSMVTNTKLTHLVLDDMPITLLS